MVKILFFRKLGIFIKFGILSKEDEFLFLKIVGEICRKIVSGYLVFGF